MPFTSQKQPESFELVFNLLPQTTDELIVIENVPRDYLDKMRPKLRGIKRLALHSYTGNYFDNVCTYLPNLEELTLELMNLKTIHLASCGRLKKVWIWNVNYAKEFVSVSIKLSILVDLIAFFFNTNIVHL